MTQFVLIHGSWHTGEHWAPVASRLEKLGHTVFAPTVLGHGKGVLKQVTHAEQVEELTAQIVRANLSDFVLVGHSYGGTVIARVAEEIPDRIRRLVFWNAFVPQKGHSLNDEVPPHYRALFEQIAGAAGDGSVMLPYPIWREAFINDADLALATRAFDRLNPHPYKTFQDPITLSQPMAACPLPKSYVNCRMDTALPQSLGWHPRLSERLGLFRYIECSGSHEVWFTDPDAIASAIEQAGRD